MSTQQIATTTELEEETPGTWAESDDTLADDDLASGLDYHGLIPEDRRAVRKQIRKFKTGF
jgi:hypothetical protein